MIRILKPFTLALCLVSLSGSQAQPQSLGSILSGKKTADTAPTAPADPLKRDTPRDAIFRFLEACHRGTFDVAAQYLDLRQLSPEIRKTEGPQLAEQLGKLLDRNPRFELSKLSNSPDGYRTDGLSSNVDDLVRLDLDGEAVTLHMQRVDQGKAGKIWLVAAASVSQVPELSSANVQNSFEKYIPAPLVNISFAATPLWIWMALVLLALILSAISKRLSQLVLFLIKPLAKRYAKFLHVQRLEAIAEPLRLILSVLVFRACLVFIPPSALVRDLLLKLLTLLLVWGAASLLMRLVDVGSDTYISRLDPHERALTYSIFPLGIRVVKLCIFAIAVLTVLEQWGYNTSAILAGLGVGGIAVALAAQKTIENLFGGVSLISDRPVLVGDFCQFGGQVGTIEDIGLRSTRIRTLDRTVVTVPNSQFSTMTLENFSKRDRMWFHPKLSLRRDTSPDQVQKMMAAIVEILEKHEMVDASGVPLRFTKIASQSLDLEVFAYVLTPDFNVYLKVQSEILLQILEASHRLGIGFAVPFQEEFNVSVNPDRPGTLYPFQALTLDSKTHSANGSGQAAGQPETTAAELQRG